MLYPDTSYRKAFVSLLVILISYLLILFYCFFSIWARRDFRSRTAGNETDTRYFVSECFRSFSFRFLLIPSMERYYFPGFSFEPQGLFFFKRKGADSNPRHPADLFRKKVTLAVRRTLCVIQLLKPFFLIKRPMLYQIPQGETKVSPLTLILFED